MVEVQYDDFDWDYYEFGHDELKEKERMTGIAKFDQMTVFKHKNNNDNLYSYLDISVNVPDLQEKFGLFAKDSQLLKTGQNLKAVQKIDQVIKEDLSKSTIPEVGKGKMISNSDAKFKYGASVVGFPQTAIGLILVSFANGKQLRGTGCMVGPNHVLTCAHILHQLNVSKEDNKITDIQFYPGLCMKNLMNGIPTVMKAIVMRQYIAKQKPELNDIGVLILDQPLGLIIGWFGMLNLPDDTLKLEKVEVVGYPKDIEQEGYIQYAQKGKLDFFNNEVLEYNFDTTQGMNGGPILLERIASQTETEHYLGGIHIGFNGKSNYGIRINTQNFIHIKDIIQFHFLNASMDESFYNRQILAQKHIQIDFEFTHATIKEIQDYFFSIRSNIELTDISIKVKTVENKPVLNNESLKELGQSLKFQRKLQNLKLDFYHCEDLSDEGLKELANGMSNCKDMKSLCVTLNGNHKFSNAGIKDFTIIYQNFQQMDSLTIFLYNISSISDESLKFIGANAIQMQQLTQLKIDLQMIKKVTEKGVKDMCSSLEKSKNLQRLNLILMGIKLTDKTKETLKEKFKNLQSYQLV